MKLKLADFRSKDGKRLDNHSGKKKNFRKNWKKINPRFRSILVMLFFLLVSSILWLITALNNENKSNVVLTFPLHYENLLSQYTFETSPPDEIQVSVNVKGMSLLKYSLWPNRTRDSIHLYVTQQDVQRRMFRVSENLLRKRVEKVLPAHVKIEKISPSAIAIPFLKSSKKEVLVEHRVLADEKSGFELSQITINPSKVVIYGAKSTLQSISSVFTQEVQLKNLSESKEIRLRLEPIPGVKFSEDSVTIKINVEELTEERLELPLKMLNVPPNCDITLLPSTINILLVLPISDYGRYKVSDFEAVVDFNDIKGENDQLNNELLRVELLKMPTTLTRYSITPERIQYNIVEKR